MTGAAMFTPLTTCLCCGSEDLAGYLDLGRQPLAHAYHQGAPQPRFPLELQVCRRCFHSQLSIAVDPALRSRNDLFVSGTTTAVRNHLRALARDAVARTRATRVLDVGCSDGALLEELHLLGCDVVGVDRSSAMRSIARGKGIRVLDAPWGQDALDELRASGDTPFELVVATNVLAQVGDPLAFLRACTDALAPGGTIVVEVPYAAGARPRHDLDLPHHEQVSYFLVRSLAVLAKRAALEIQHVERTGPHGDSIRLFLREPDRLPVHGPSVHAFMDHERERGLHDSQAYAPIHLRVERSGRALGRVLDDARVAGRKVIGYGASARGNVLLNRFDLGLDHLVDDDPLKWSFRVPGKDTPVLSPQTLVAEPSPLAILVLAWEAFDEVRRKVLAFRGTKRDDTFVLCAPSIREVPTWAPAVLVDLDSLTPEELAS